MSKLTLDEAIKHCLEVAEKNDGEAEVYDLLAKNHNSPYEKLTASRFYTDCAECAAVHRQLAEWLMEYKDLKAEQNDQYVFIHELMSELKEAKRLLKAAVEDLRYLESHTVDKEGSCLISDRGERIRCFDCPFNNGGKVNEKCVWNYEAEALKLLNDEK